MPAPRRGGIVLGPAARPRLAMPTPSSILFSDMTPGASWEPAFHAWYDGEHIPLRMRCPGFRSAQRYRVCDFGGAAEGGFLTVYELDALAALDTPEYRRIKQAPSGTTRRMLDSVSGFTRYLGEPIDDRWGIAGAGGAGLDSPFLYAVFFQVPPEAQPDFDAWYAEDHVPLLLECPDWLRVRRFRVVDGAPGAWNRLAIHHLATREALDSPQREAARVTPWRSRLGALPWFRGRYRLYTRLGDRQVGTGASVHPPATQQ